jgi:hypothetical protein
MFPIVIIALTKYWFRAVDVSCVGCELFNDLKGNNDGHFVWEEQSQLQSP